MLKEWFENLDITRDPFDQFKSRQQCIELIFHSKLSKIDLQQGIETIVNIIISPSSTKSTFYLTICHDIFKHGRQNKDDSSHLAYQLLNCLEEKESISLWIKQKLSGLSSVNEEECVPFLIFMIDLLKTMTVMGNGNIIFLDNIVMSDDDDQWISTLTQLWYHSHIAVVRKSMEFTIRLLKYYSTIKQLNLKVVPQFISFIYHCKAVLSPFQLQLLQEHDRTEFIYQPLFNDKDNHTLTLDRECLNLLIQISITIIYNIIQYDINDVPMSIKISLEETMTLFLKFISNICGSNDQSTIRLQLDILHIHLLLEQQQSTMKKKSCISWSNLFSPLFNHINPHTLFLYFLQRTGMDHELIIDLLISNETDMLLFLVKYLKFIERHPTTFITTFNQLIHDEYIEEEEEIDGEEADEGEHIYTFISLLYQLTVILQSNVFPYNATVLVRRINSVIQCLQQLLE
ncbi:hypothetical protein BJ944DRAFT_240244 [Cunninghamella echinulata]|nr:hypothetical protein BJ944DRAFT_240244 [Cunninghamella echinulata]